MPVQQVAAVERDRTAEVAGQQPLERRDIALTPPTHGAGGDLQVLVDVGQRAAQGVQQLAEVRVRLGFGRVGPERGREPPAGLGLGVQHQVREEQLGAGGVEPHRLPVEAQREPPEQADRHRGSHGPSFAARPGAGPEILVVSDEIGRQRCSPGHAGSGLLATALPAGVVVLAGDRLDRCRCRPGVVPGDGRGRPDDALRSGRAGQHDRRRARHRGRGGAGHRGGRSRGRGGRERRGRHVRGRCDRRDRRGGGGLGRGGGVGPGRPARSRSGREGAKPIAAASLTKLYTVVDVLTRAAAGQIALTDADRG